MSNSHTNKFERLSIDEAIEVFVKGISIIRSVTHPYPAVNVEGMWILRDDPPRKRDSRKVEIISFLSAAKTIEILSRQELGRYYVGVFTTNDQDKKETKAHFKANNFRLITTEQLFLNPLHELPPIDLDSKVESIKTQAELDEINAVTGYKRSLIPGTRKYCVVDRSPGAGVKDMGWVTSVPVDGNAYVTSLWVDERVRRNGYGHALMSKMLADDVSHGIGQSVLMATKAGSRLYPKVGYQLLADLQIFCRKKSPVI